MSDSEMLFIEQLKAKETSPEAPRFNSKKLSELTAGDVKVLGFQEVPNKLTIIDNDELGDISAGKVTGGFKVFINKNARRKRYNRKKQWIQS